MKIIDHTVETLPFHRLSIHDTFTLREKGGGDIYMVIRSVKYKEEYIGNAVNLTTATVTSFNQENLVYPINCELHVNRN